MTNANNPAMPLGEGRVNLATVNQSACGLTKREYFAGLALQALTVDAETTDTPQNFAKGAVILADALLAELEKQ